MESQAVGAEGGSRDKVCGLSAAPTRHSDSSWKCRYIMWTRNAYLQAEERGASHTHVYTHTDTYMHIHVCICTQMYTCMHIHTHMRSCIQAQTYTHTTQHYTHRCLCLPCRMKHAQLFQGLSAPYLLVSGLYFALCILSNSRPTEVTRVCEVTSNTTSTKKPCIQLVIYSAWSLNWVFTKNIK